MYRKAARRHEIDLALSHRNGKIPLSMKVETPKDEVIAQYLLGKLSEQDQIHLEQQYFSNAEVFERFLLIENELIDDYLRAQLCDEDRELFEKHFLAVAARAEKVEFSKSLIKIASSSTRPKMREASSSNVDWWKGYFGWLSSGLSPASKALLVAVMALIAVGGTWLGLQSIRLRREVDQLRAEQIAQQQRENELRQQLAEMTADNDKLADQLALQQQQQVPADQAPESPPSSPIISFVLTPHLLRDINGANKLIIPRGTQLIHLRLRIGDEGDYKSYSAVLKTVQGDSVWSRASLQAQRTKSGKAVILRLSPGLLNRTDYILTLKGRTSSGELEDIEDYSFNIQKK